MGLEGREERGRGGRDSGKAKAKEKATHADSIDMDIPRL